MMEKIQSRGNYLQIGCFLRKNLELRIFQEVYNKMKIKQEREKESLVGKKLKSYSLIRKLGSGSYSIVYEAIDSNTKQTVAIKAIPWKIIHAKPKLKELVETQIKVLRSCQNENVIKHVDSFKSEKNVFIVTQFCEGGDVQTYLNKKGRLSEEQATDILKQILNGFRGLHEVKAMHRDFKLANLLMQNKIIKIADLGFAKQLQKESSVTKTQLGTGVTMAPQILDGKEYGMYADIWSIGIVYYQMIFGSYPFNGPTDTQIRRKIQKRNILYPKNIKISENAKDFIERCLTIDPRLRISWREIYQHPLITNENNLLYSLSMSKQKLESNKQYYLHNEMQAQKKFVYPEKQQFITSGQELKQINPEQLKEQSNLEILKNQNQAKKKKSIQISQYEEVLLKKRNNIMFMFKYFVPKIACVINEINAIHSIALFLICKKTLIELQNLVDEINEKKLICKENSVLKYFFQSPNCLQYLNLLLEDIDMIKQQSLFYKQDIRGSPLVQSETSDITKWKNPQWQKLLHEVFETYWYQISQNIDSFKLAKSTNSIIQILRALQFYYKSDEVSVQVFNLIMQTLDYQQYKLQITRKIYASMIAAN